MPGRLEQWLVCLQMVMDPNVVPSRGNSEMMHDQRVTCYQLEVHMYTHGFSIWGGVCVPVTVVPYCRYVHYARYHRLQGRVCGFRRLGSSEALPWDTTSLV